MSTLIPSRPRRTSALLVGAALLAPAVAAANDAAFSAHVPFSGSRSTDLRVGEPLEFVYKGQKIRKVCWSPAPIQHAACSTAFAAPAKVGTQKLTVTLKNGAVKHETLTIGAPATTLSSEANAGTPSAHVVEYVATCDTFEYATYAGGHLEGTRKGFKLHTGDKVAGFYRAGPHAIQGLAYRSPEPGFFNDHCLKLAS